jgi:peroxiredoxin
MDCPLVPYLADRALSRAFPGMLCLIFPDHSLLARLEKIVMRNTFRILGLLFLALIFGMAVGCLNRSSAPGEGSVAPDFTLKDLSGKTLRLSQLRGTVVLLNFWATWCPPCREEVPSLARLNAEMAGKEFRMVTVSIDEAGGNAVESFFRMSGFHLPTLPDPDARIAKLFGVKGVPETFILDRNGVIRKKIVGPLDWDDPSIVSYLTELQER